MTCVCRVQKNNFCKVYNVFYIFIDFCGDREVRLAQSVINNNTISQDEDDVASTFDSSLHSADNMINNSAEEIVTNLSSFHEYTDIKSEEDQMRAKRHNSYFGHGNRTNTSESTLGPKSEDDLHSIERLAIQSEEDRSIINIKSETISDLSSLRPGSLAAVYCHAEPGNVQKDWILASVVIQVNINLVNNTYDYEMQDYDLTPENNTSLSSLGAHGERGTLDSGIGGKRSPRKSGGLPTRRIVNSLDIKPIESTTDEEAIERLSSSVRAKSKVLALFPGTTCLYPATVISVPNRVSFCKILNIIFF